MKVEYELEYCGFRNVGVPFDRSIYSTKAKAAEAANRFLDTWVEAAQSYGFVDAGTEVSESDPLHPYVQWIKLDEQDTETYPAYLYIKEVTTHELDL